MAASLSRSPAEASSPDSFATAVQSPNSSRYAGMKDEDDGDGTAQEHPFALNFSEARPLARVLEGQCQILMEEQVCMSRLVVSPRLTSYVK